MADAKRVATTAAKRSSPAAKRGRRDEHKWSDVAERSAAENRPPLHPRAAQEGAQLRAHLLLLRGRLEGALDSSGLFGAMLSNQRIALFLLEFLEPLRGALIALGRRRRYTLTSTYTLTTAQVKNPPPATPGPLCGRSAPDSCRYARDCCRRPLRPVGDLSATCRRLQSRWRVGGRRCDSCRVRRDRFKGVARDGGRLPRRDCAQSRARHARDHTKYPPKSWQLLRTPFPQPRPQP